MSHLETLYLSHLPTSLPIHIALFRDLRNAAFLREQLLSGNSAFEYAFVDASMIFSRTHILAAIFRAVNGHISSRLKSRNVHSEIVFCLSPNNNIAESFRKFGITDSTKDLLVVKVSVTPDITHDSVVEHLGKFIEATPLPFDDETLATLSNISKIRKVYKLSPALAVAATTSSCIGEAGGGEKKGLEACVLGAMALRGAS